MRTLISKQHYIYGLTHLFESGHILLNCWEMSRLFCNTSSLWMKIIFIEHLHGRWFSTIHCLICFIITPPGWTQPKRYKQTQLTKIKYLSFQVSLSSRLTLCFIDAHPKLVDSWRPLTECVLAKFFKCRSCILFHCACQCPSTKPVSRTLPTYEIS